ncbi:MAG: helix-turn-helix transcriptional regulator [Bacteriovorax sp.]|nr:helix-turn-helix transcriptional regulator [Bacteriovorax sp.]
MDELELGTCVKSADRKVLFQNDLCLKTCGSMEGRVCTKGCMVNYSPVSGMTLVKHSVVDNFIVDAVVINDGKMLTTLIYPNIRKEEERKKDSEMLLSYELSKSELIIFLKVLEGEKNSQIIKDLFISKSTLKTHLNNIYKKLPENYQQYKNRR